MDSLGGNLVRALYGYSSKQVELTDLDQTGQSHLLKDAGTGSFSIFSSKRGKKTKKNLVRCWGRFFEELGFAMSSFRKVQLL